MTQIVLPYDKSPRDFREHLAEWGKLAELQPHVSMVKIGLEAMTATLMVNSVPTSSALMLRYKLPAHLVLWDQKIDDIGNTDEKTILNLDGYVAGVTLHASVSASGLRKMAEARDRAHAKRGGLKMRLFGVTVLTDIDDGECLTIFGDNSRFKVRDFARRLIDNGIDGIVCSGRELEFLRESGVEGLTSLVPGIRPTWSETGDQKRIVTPAEAAKLGADYIVVGRPIMDAPDPVAAAKRVREEVREALMNK